MMEKSDISKFLVVLAFVFIFVGGVRFFTSSPVVSGMAAGSISIYITANYDYVTIDYPENTTYSFDIGVSRTLELNVSSPMNIASWTYTIQDLTHPDVDNVTGAFVPNITFEPFRWSNKLTVYGQKTSGGILTARRTFYVSVPNSAPIINNFGDNLYACEGQNFSQRVNATDIDEDSLVTDLVPENPFFVSNSTTINLTDSYATIFSANLTKSQTGVYQEVYSVSDGEYSDSRNFNITVIEINNAPTMRNLGAETLYTSGENSILSKQVNVTDVEDGSQSSGNLTFNVSVSGEEINLSIDNFGLITYNASGSSIGTYDVTVCVRDRGLENPHQNISLCEQTGLNISICKSFDLTITDDNRVPLIISSDQSIVSGNTLQFSITKQDLDGGIPDSYWYVDGVLKQVSSGTLVNSFISRTLIDTFSYAFSSTGTYNVTVVVSDGLLNTSLYWPVIITIAPETGTGTGGTSGGGGGGGGGGTASLCNPNWVCMDWGVCQNALRSFELGLVLIDVYSKVVEQCNASDFAGTDLCGYQVKNCVDYNSCKINVGKLSEVQACHYVVNPSCQDGVKNCHDGYCELLIDCGGPCSQCPSCSDKTQNQGELGIDCGGPCPWACQSESPSGESSEIYSWLVYGVYGLVGISVIVIIYWFVESMTLFKGRKIKRK